MVLTPITRPVRRPAARRNCQERAAHWPAPRFGSERAQRADGMNHSGCQGTHKSERIAYGDGELTRTQSR